MELRDFNAEADGYCARHIAKTDFCSSTGDQSWVPQVAIFRSGELPSIPALQIAEPGLRFL
jgi:hypothetical protein